MSDEPYYADTAYNSTKPRNLPVRLPREKWSAGSREARGNEKPLPWGEYVGDYRDNNAAAHVRKIRSRSEAQLMKDLSAEAMRFTSMDNPKAKWWMLRGVAGLTSIATGATTILIMSVRSDAFLQHPAMLLLFFVPLALFFVGHIGLRMSKDKYDIVLNRRTGVVTLPVPSLKKTVYLRFDELDGYIRSETSPAGGLRWQLHLGLRGRNGGVELVGAESAHKAVVFHMWELLQRFMDTAKPLPDLVLMEPVRHLDPVTAAYDNAHNRPPHYWRDSDPAQVAQVASAVERIVKKFPWEFLPRNNDPYGQYGSLTKWSALYPEDAAVGEGLKNKDWWDSAGKEAPSWEAMALGYEGHKQRLAERQREAAAAAAANDS